MSTGTRVLFALAAAVNAAVTVALAVAGDWWGASGQAAFTVLFVLYWRLAEENERLRSKVRIYRRLPLLLVGNTVSKRCKSPEPVGGSGSPPG